jgi:uracil-DNA glycosylase
MQLTSEANRENRDLKQPLPESWMNVLGSQFDLPYMRTLRQFLKDQMAAGEVIYPAPLLWFNAFWQTPLDQVKVVIIGQDPYHGPGQAHGMCFSVLPGVDVPPSLVNIYKELKSDLGLPIPPHGHLQSWANQGVFLLNATLTVAAHRAGSHQKKGWELFTDATVKALNDHCQHLVFFLWGSYAQKKGEHLDRARHLVLHSPHPSPLSSHRGFFGSKPFSKANQYLAARGRQPIDWSVM